MTTPKIIALEGVGGSGKSTLAKPLAEALGARLIKRPLTPLRDAPSIADMDADADLTRAQALTAPTPCVVLDRHWLSACVYQAADSWPACIAQQAQRHGEPDVWVILSAPTHTILHRLASRPADGARHLDTGRAAHVVAGRIHLYDDAPRHLRAPVVEVRWLPPSQPVSYERIAIRSFAGDWWHQAPMTPWELAQLVAAHVRALT